MEHAATLADDLVDVEDAAWLFKVSPGTIRTWVTRYKILPRGRVTKRSPGRRKGRLLFSVQDLLDAEMKARDGETRARQTPTKPIDV